MAMAEDINRAYGEGRVPVYVDPETGMFRASTDISHDNTDGYIHMAAGTYSMSTTMTADGDVYQEKAAMEKKTGRKKRVIKKADIDLNKTIQDIIRKYLVVRNGILGAEVYVPASKVPDLIKDIAQLVNDYLAAEMKKYKDRKKAAEKAEEIRPKINKIWEEFNKQIGDVDKWVEPAKPARPWPNREDYYGDPNPYRKVMAPPVQQPKWTSKSYISDKVDKHRTEG